MMVGISADTEALLVERAAAAGMSPEAFVRLSVSRPVMQPTSTSRRGMPTGAELIAGMEAIALRSAARLSLDERSSDEIIGYDDLGIPG